MPALLCVSADSVVVRVIDQTVFFMWGLSFQSHHIQPSTSGVERGERSGQ